MQGAESRARLESKRESEPAKPRTPSTRKPPRSDPEIRRPCRSRSPSRQRTKVGKAHGETSANHPLWLHLTESKLATSAKLSLTSFSELDEQRANESARLIIFSLEETNTQESAEALSIISTLAPSLPTIVLSSKYNFEVMRAVIGYGAKGYIPMTMGFEIAVEAVRFVLAGGTYVPAESILSAIPSGVTPSRPPASGAITDRELAVVRAIHQGKPNKIIAYELNMCESTVKVHVRHIMKKLRAKNRTDVAIKSTALLACSRCTTQSECWAAGRCSMRFA